MKYSPDFPVFTKRRVWEVQYFQVIVILIEFWTTYQINTLMIIWLVLVQNPVTIISFNSCPAFKPKTNIHYIRFEMGLSAKWVCHSLFFKEKLQILKH